MEEPVKAPQDPSPVSPMPSAIPLAALKTSSLSISRASSRPATADCPQPVHVFSYSAASRPAFSAICCTFFSVMRPLPELDPSTSSDPTLAFDPERALQVLELRLAPRQRSRLLEHPVALELLDHFL